VKEETPDNFSLVRITGRVEKKNVLEIQGEANKVKETIPTVIGML